MDAKYKSRQSTHVRECFLDNMHSRLGNCLDNSASYHRPMVLHGLSLGICYATKGHTDAHRNKPDDLSSKIYNSKRRTGSLNDTLS